MTVNMQDVVHSFKGHGVAYSEIMYNTTSVLPLFYFDLDTINNGSSKSLKSKSLAFEAFISEDGTSARWRERDIRDPQTTLAGAETAGATTITVADASIFVAKDVIRNSSTGENMTIASIAGNVITLTGAIAADMSTADTVMWVSYPDQRRPVSLTMGDEQSNSITETSHEIVLNKAELNKTYSFLKDGQEVFVEKVKTATRKMMHQVHNTLYVGDGVVDGLDQIVGSNVKDLAGASDKFQALVDALMPAQNVGTDGNNELYLLISPYAAARLVGLTADAGPYTIQERDLKGLGVTIQYITTPYGKVNIFTDFKLSELYGKDANIAFTIKPELIKMVSAVNYPSYTGSNKVDGIGIFEQPQSSHLEMKIDLFANYSFQFGGNTTEVYSKILNIGE